MHIDLKQEQQGECYIRNEKVNWEVRKEYWPSFIIFRQVLALWKEVGQYYYGIYVT